MWKLKLLPDETHIRFIRMRGPAFALSLVALVLATGAFATRGLNFGVDFRGGSLIEIDTPAPADIPTIRSSLRDLGVGDVVVRTFGADDDVLITLEQQPATADMSEAQAQQATLNLALDTLEQTIPDFERDTMLRRAEVVSGVVSGELVRAGAFAVIGALVLMLAYIWFRFEWQFSVGAVAALAHDVWLTIGMFSVTGIEFNLSIIAAILTIVGYSMNDTVVVYDRIRENMRKFKRMPLEELLDGAINQTLSRTTMTSLTTLLALVSLYFLGGEVLRGFSFAMIWGVVVGTYSSIFIASPILLFTGVRREGAEAAKADPLIQ